jgi:hypothetical protein
MIAEVLPSHTPWIEQHETHIPPQCQDPELSTPHWKRKNQRMTDQSPRARTALPPTKGEVIIYQHSDLLYWWPIWLYGYICAGFTFILGKRIDIGGHKAVQIFPDAWLGLSFVLLFMLIVTLTHMKSRGVYSIVIALVGALLAIGVQWAYGWGQVFSGVTFLLIYMNLAFYLLVSTWLLVIWLASVFWVDRMSYWRFIPGQVVEHHLWGVDNVYDTLGMTVKKLPDDLMLHKVLGLGTGDLVLSTTGATERQILIENVWRVRKQLPDIEKLIVTRL